MAGTAGALILKALKAVGTWVLANPNIVTDTVHLITDKKGKTEERLQDVEEKVHQVGAAALELNQKIDTEVDALRKEMRAVKIALIAMGAALVASIIAIILLTILR